ncbi:phasin family protein [Zhaonella formicivorans]|jgi:polyhydroxyalkanoate synthesis regulator phasin|uniref:phasin family protein n=1 Tax=Zhaonella formicivorans TaxID=2528593 RepID=UPI0010DD9728|nr:hypothetical protein [Zhaonella formicivorans]
MMLDLMRRAMHVGIGALSLTREKAEQLMDELVKKGEMSQSEAKEFIENLIERGKQEQAEIRNMIRQEVQKFQEEFPLVSRKEVKELEERIAKLEAMLNKQNEEQPE